MKRLRRGYATISRISCFIIMALLLSAGFVAAAQQSPPAGCRFEVVSVKALSNDEALERTPPDVIGPNVAVRLRLSCDDAGLYVLTSKDLLAPLGYAVKSTDRGVIWLSDKHGQQSSPGLQKLTSIIPSAWFGVPKHSAIEWELLDSTTLGGEKHAFTVFIKQGEKGEPKEIISDPFVVPSGPSPIR